MRRTLLASTILTLIAAMGWAAETPSAKTVTINASDTPVAQVLADVAKTTGATILTEKLVSGNVTASVKEATTEKALDAVTKPLKLQWRKISVPEGSVLAKDGDALAAQMRTVLALRFPDIVISEVGSGEPFVHVQRESAAGAIVKTIPPAAGFKTVYLVTDDEKAYKKEVKDESKKKVANYVSANKALVDQFLKMSPEERKAVLRESMGLMSQMDPKMMAEMMASMSDLDPEFITRQNRMGMEAMMNMTPEARRNMLRLSIRSQMEMMKSMPPEMMQQFQQEAAAIAAEMAGGQQNGQ